MTAPEHNIPPRWPIEAVVTHLEPLLNDSYRVGQESGHRRPDVRFGVFAAINQHVRATIWILRALTWKRSPEDLAACFTHRMRSGDALSGTLPPEREVLQFVKAALVEQIYFSVDHFLESMARAAGGQDCNGFKKAGDFILTVASSIDRSRAQTAFKVFTASRNCGHNNGVHRHSSFSAVVGDQRFDFTQGDLASVGNWPQVITLLGEVIDVCGLVAAAPEFSNLGVIVDEMALAAEEGRVIQTPIVHPGPPRKRRS